MIEELESTGTGVPVAPGAPKPLVHDGSFCEKSNRALLKQIKEGKHAECLLQEALKDEKAGRITGLAPIEVGSVLWVCSALVVFAFDLQACDLQQTLLHPRFAAENVKPDGSIKVRPVDHFSWSAFGEKKEGSVNGHVQPCEKLKHDTLDMFAQVPLCVRLVHCVRVFPVYVCAGAGIVRGDDGSAAQPVES